MKEEVKSQTSIASSPPRKKKKKIGVSVFLDVFKKSMTVFLLLLHVQSLKERDGRKEKTQVKVKRVHTVGGVVEHGNEGKKTRVSWKSHAVPSPHTNHHPGLGYRSSPTSRPYQEREL